MLSPLATANPIDPVHTHVVTLWLVHTHVVTPWPCDSVHTYVASVNPIDPVHTPLASAYPCGHPWPVHPSV